MSFWENVIQEIKLNFYDYIAESHAFIIDNVLQSFFFMMAIISIISWSLNSLDIFFAKSLTKSAITKLIIFALFLYLKVWDAYSAYMQILGYFCSVTVSIHLYEGCVRLGSHFVQKYSKNCFGNISSAISVVVIFLSVKLFGLFQLDQKDGKYPYVALYFMTLALIMIISLMRRKQFIYVLLITGVMGSIIMLRHWSIQILKETLLQKVSLPFEAIFYLTFALQENHYAKQDENLLKKLQGQQIENQNKIKVSQLMWAQAYYYAFFLVNKRMYNIEIVFASICVLSYLGVKRYQ